MLETKGQNEKLYLSICICVYVYAGICVSVYVYGHVLLGAFFLQLATQLTPSHHTGIVAS